MVVDIAIPSIPVNVFFVARPAAIEGLGTAVLAAAVVGSGIMGERLAGGNVAVALLANTLATGATLFALILAFAPVSGAHFNPVVTGVLAAAGEITWATASRYVAAQLIGALAGVAAAHVMFDLPIFSASAHLRAGPSQLFSEFVATFGLLVVILATGRRGNTAHVAAAVAAYITGAYWFTASTSFANPALTIARSLSDTFAGIRPADVPGFIAVQLTGAAAAAVFLRWAFAHQTPGIGTVPAAEESETVQ
jgi:glycerol uptake facilitator-like aquaporin